MALSATGTSISVSPTYIQDSSIYACCTVSVAATTNYTSYSNMKSIVIYYYVTAPTSGKSYTYTGSTITAYSSSSNSYYTIYGYGSGTDVGTYSASAVLSNSYYKWDDGTTATKSLTWYITRAKTATASASNKTYSGSAQTGVTGSNVTWSGTTSATNAGTYTAYATPTSNYAWSDGTYAQKTITWTIAQKAVTITLAAQSTSYPTAKSYTFTSDGDGTFTASSATTSVATVAISGKTLTLTPKATGTSKITVTHTAKSGGNYKTGSATFTFTVSAGTITVTTNNKSADYTGSAISPNTVSVTAPSSGATVKYGTASGTYTLTSPQTYTNAGTYTVYYQVTATNYTTKTGSYTLTINRAKTATASASNKTYSGSAQTGVTGSNVTWSGTTSATNAGTYTAYATPTSNYAWSDGTYAQKTITWTMAQKAVTITLADQSTSYPTAKSYTFTSDGDGTFTASSGTTSVATVSISGKTLTLTPVSIGTSIITITHTTKSGGNYKTGSASFTFTIGKGTPSAKLTINGTVEIGQTLTAEVSTEADGTKSYQWWVSETSSATSKTNLSGATSETYKITESELDKYVGCTVTIAEGTKYKSCSASGITEVVAKTEAGEINYVNSFDTVKLLLQGTDDNYSSNSLTTSNIVVKVGGTTITPTTKTLSSPTTLTNGVQYELTLSGLTGDGELSIEVDKETLTDKSNNKNILTKFNSDIVVDNTVPTLESIKVTSPDSGTYKVGQKITIVATYSESVTGSAPVLTLKFGNTASKGVVGTGTISGKTITYTYTITSGDTGLLAISNLTGTSLTDLVGNIWSAKVVSNTGNIVEADAN